LAAHRLFFRFAAIIAIIVGLFIIIVGFLILFSKNSPLGTLVGLLLFIFLALIGGFELASFRSLWGREVGSWRTTMMIAIISAVTLSPLLFLGSSVLITFNSNILVMPIQSLLIFFGMVLLAVFQIVIVIMLYVWRKDFMPSQQEIEIAMKRMTASTVKTASECPNCHELVEKDWVLCPQCGTPLPRMCANCGNLLTVKSEKCPSCGQIMEPPEAINKTIDTLKKLSEEEARPEARSVRFARLAEVYLKAGETDQALESYRKAIHYTEFDRKRCNFMVKMAVVLDSSGRQDDAFKLLDAALDLDAEDASGARNLKNQILARDTAQRALESHKAGNVPEALQLAEKALAIDPADFRGVGFIKATDLVGKANALLKEGKKEEALKLLDEAIRLDPNDVSGAAKKREQLVPTKKKKRKKK